MELASDDMCIVIVLWVGLLCGRVRRNNKHLWAQFAHWWCDDTSRCVSHYARSSRVRAAAGSRAHLRKPWRLHFAGQTSCCRYPRRTPAPSCKSSVQALATFRRAHPEAKLTFESESNCHAHALVILTVLLLRLYVVNSPRRRRVREAMLSPIVGLQEGLLGCSTSPGRV